jgi:hypothetical protein
LGPSGGVSQAQAEMARPAVLGWEWAASRDSDCFFILTIPTSIKTDKKTMKIFKNA